MAGMINDSNNLIPEGNIALVPLENIDKESIPFVVDSLRGCIKRSWLNEHAYYCLPLIIGSQYGFVIKSTFSFTAVWNGKEGIDATTITIHDQKLNSNNHPMQFISSHFGSGIITLQNRFYFRTPLGVNLMTINPPNYFIPYLQNLTAVVETDNLRRDFTFNLKITTPNVDVKVNVGDIISAFIPIPRFFVDKFDLVLADEILSKEVIELDLDQGNKFKVERLGADKEKPHQAGRRYFKGIDADNNLFYQHQQRIAKPKLINKNLKYSNRTNNDQH